MRGAGEIGFTVISLTLSLIAVFIPLLFMTGLVGRMFREFALTLTIAVVASAIVSLTLTPMMCGRLLRARSGGTRRRRLRGASAQRFNELIERRSSSIARSLRMGAAPPARDTDRHAGDARRRRSALYIMMPKGFLPLQDTGLITAVTEAGTDVSFDEMQRLQRRSRT